MKWFLIGSLCLVCLTGRVWGTPADDLYNKGVDALSGEQYDKAADFFSQLIKGYPTGAHVDDARVSAGYSYLRSGKYAESIAILEPLINDPLKVSYKATALYFTSLDQFTQAQKETDKEKSKGYFGDAVKTFTQLIEVCTKTPTADNKSYLEPAIYYRSLSEFSRDEFDAAEKDLLQVIKQFPDSLSLPDYYLRLGTVYNAVTNNAVQDKKTLDEVQPLADKTIAAYDHVSRDPNALVQANDANMSKAEVLYMIAQLDSTKTSGYQKALEAYRQVRRRDDIIPLQIARIDQLKKQLQEAIKTDPSAGKIMQFVIQREEGHLAELQDKSNPDPVVLALTRMAECYIAMQTPESADNARTILHRLAKVKDTLPAEQQQEIDFDTLYSYVLGGQTDKADAALTDYLAKHGTDPNASSISYQIAAKLYARKNFPGALASIQRSLKDFPEGKGKYADDALGLEAQILTSMGKIDESKAIIDNFLKANPNSPKAIGLLMTRAQNEENDKDYTSALADYKTVKENASASEDLRSAAYASYIKVLHTTGKQDDVIAEAKTFITQYPQAKALAGVMLFSALSLSEKKDPGAVVALKEVAQKFPDDKEIAPFALFSIVNFYHVANNVPGMIEAANDLRTKYPEAYPFLLASADMVSQLSVKAKKFDDAVALYQPLTQAPNPEIAATAGNKVGALWLGAAKSMGAYQSLPLKDRPGGDRETANKRAADSEQAYVGVLKNFPDQLNAVGDAFEGLNDLTKMHRSWGLVKDPELENYLGKVTADLTTPDMQARVEMAKAGLVFIMKNGAAQYPVALDRFKKAMAANPSLVLTRQEADQFGALSLAAKDYTIAAKVYGDLLNNASRNDLVTQGYAYYGLGATAMAQGDLATAKTNFLKLKASGQNGLWHPQIQRANLGIAMADEKSDNPADLDEAKAIYSSLVQSQGGPELAAQGMLGFGRILEKEGFGLKPAPSGNKDFAVFLYQEPNLLYGPAVAQLSAEGLYFAGQVYQKAGDKVNAKAQYDTLISTYGTTAPDWVDKAKAAEGSL